MQFRYPEVADIVSETMNGYLLMGKVIMSNTLAPSQKNPFYYSTSGKYRFINWKRMFVEQNKQPKTDLQVAGIIHSMLKK